MTKYFIINNRHCYKGRDMYCKITCTATERETGTAKTGTVKRAETGRVKY